MPRRANNNRRYRTMQQFSAEFELLKDTKNTYRYSEVGNIPKIGNLYVQKFAMGEEAPQRPKVTVEAV